MASGRAEAQIQVPKVEHCRTIWYTSPEYRPGFPAQCTGHALKSPGKWYLAPSWHRKIWAASVSHLDTRACVQHFCIEAV